MNQASEAGLVIRLLPYCRTLEMSEWLCMMWNHRVTDVTSTLRITSWSLNSSRRRRNRSKVVIRVTVPRLCRPLIVLTFVTQECQRTAMMYRIGWSDWKDDPLEGIFGALLHGSLKKRRGCLVLQGVLRTPILMMST